MDARIVKLLLVVAIAVAVFKLVSHRRRRWGGLGGRRWNVRPYEGYEDDEEYEAGGDEDDAGWEDSEYDEAEPDGNVDYEEDYDQDGDEDGEYDDEDGEYDEDEDEENEMVETFSNAMPRAGAMPGAPMLSVATDLLPKPSAQVQKSFGEFAPKSLLGQNFLDAKKYIGVDTKGSSLRNANYDLRSSPAIPRKDVGPWANSTIDSDLYRKPLE